MSNLHLSPRALLALLILPLFTVLACASGRGRDTVAASDRPEGGTSSIADGSGPTIERLLEGRFPGVTLARTHGGGLQIRIRGGSNSFYASDEPLYVLDGTPLPPGAGGIVFINPHDIQLIEVLKNPADIGIYGMRGANGVVRITTKRPGQR